MVARQQQMCAFTRWRLYKDGEVTWLPRTPIRPTPTVPSGRVRLGPAASNYTLKGGCAKTYRHDVTARFEVI